MEPIEKLRRCEISYPPNVGKVSRFERREFLLSSRGCKMPRSIITQSICQPLLPLPTHEYMHSGWDVGVILEVMTVVTVLVFNEYLYEANEAFYKSFTDFKGEMDHDAGYLYPRYGNVSVHGTHPVPVYLPQSCTGEWQGLETAKSVTGSGYIRNGTEWNGTKTNRLIMGVRRIH
jgi:hypothetical protein